MIAMTWRLAWQILAGVGFAAACLGVLMLALAALMFLWDEADWPLLGKLAGTVAVVACVAVAVVGAVTVGPALGWDRNGGRHQWHGGRGPATECWFEVRRSPRTISNGKTTMTTYVDETWTVCQ